LTPTSAGTRWPSSNGPDVREHPCLLLANRKVNSA
jgi:hypothetical protein